MDKAKELKHQLNRLSRLTDSLIKIEVDLNYLTDEVTKIRLKLNDCIYHIRKPERAKEINETD